MTSRLLPREEYHRLEGTELDAVWPLLPEDAHVIVVEDGDEIVACWSAFRRVHLEGCWQAEAHRGKAAVARHLMATMRRVVEAMGADVVVTAATSDDVRQLLAHMGAVELPGTHYAVRL